MKPLRWPIHNPCPGTNIFAAEWPERAAVRALFCVIAEEPEFVRRQPLLLGHTLDQADTRRRRMPRENDVTQARPVKAIGEAVEQNTLARRKRWKHTAPDDADPSRRQKSGELIQDRYAEKSPEQRRGLSVHVRNVVDFSADSQTQKEDYPVLLRNAFALLNRLLPTEEAFAHCDIPCGIYDTHLMQLAALSVVRMNQLINDLAPPASMEKADRDKYMHALVRYTQVKEEHAEIVKREARIIRGDFFKPDNSPPNLGELTDGIMKTASKARQNVDIDAANELLNLTQQFAEAFWKAKGVETKRQPSNQAAGGEYVVPAN